LGDSKNVIDEWYTYEMFLYTVTQDKFSLRQLFDLRAGVPPIAYFLKKTRQLFAEVPNISRHKVALVYSPRHGSLIYAGISLMNMLPVARGTTRYFREEQYTNALNWLREIKS